MRFIRQSFRSQVFFIFLIVILLLVIGGGVVTIRGFQARVTADYERLDAEQERLAQEVINDILLKTENAFERILKNENLARAFARGESGSPIVYSALYLETEEIRDFAVAELYSGSVCTYSTGSGMGSGELPDYYSVLYEAENSGGRTVYALDPGNASEKGAALLMARRVESDAAPGFVVIRITQDVLRERIGAVINARDGFILTNRYLRPFCTLGAAEDGVLLSMLRNNLLGDLPYDQGLDGNIYIHEIGDTGLLSVYITPPALDETTISAGYQIILILAAISILVCLIVANMLSNYVASPIRKFTMGMKRFRDGNFDVRIELDREDEFQQLAVGFNKMADQLEKTMAEQVQAERTINETRIRMMQSQLNPHFLYNTLDTIKWVAKANNVPEVATMAASLAGILRASISEKQLYRLSEELALVRDYCEIQQIRFDGRFDLTIDVPEELESAVIPRLILQPMVENAIIHGLDEREEGHILIEAVREGSASGDILKIAIRDNGKGISDEMMNALNRDDEQALNGHLGLNNVNTIIRLYYGREYGVRASRPETGGTVMTVTLPYSDSIPENRG